MTHSVIAHLLSLAIDVGRLCIWLVLLVCIFVPLEHLFGLHPAKIWRKQVGVDLAYYFINSLLPAIFMAVPLLVLSRALNGFDPGGFYSTVSGLPLGFKIPLVLLVTDLGGYWAHRAFHHFPVLWRFHAVHHSAENLDWLVNTRAHPVDLVFTRMCAVAPVYLLGLAQATPGGLDPVIALVAITGTIWTFFVHANVNFRLGPLEWLISSPAFHHWHHTKDQHRNHNFAAMFPVIDKIFGTAWLPRHWPSAYGIKASMPTSLSDQLWSPMVRSVPRSSAP
jgi:sterol desaturase/sphingolipid hydroxylase (fatty acid hydroxylase superfamily)